MILETQRLILREWQDDDLDVFARMNRDPLVMEYFPRSLDMDDTKKLVKRFKAHLKKHGYGFLALELKETGQFIGFVGLGTVDMDVPFKPAVEIAWRLDYEHWGKGYATESALAIANHAFDALEMDEIVAFTVFDNRRSIHVMEKLGMVRDEGGNFHYPRLPKDNPLAKHVLYRLNKQGFASVSAAA